MTPAKRCSSSTGRPLPRRSPRLEHELERPADGAGPSPPLRHEVAHRTHRRTWRAGWPPRPRGRPARSARRPRTRAGGCRRPGWRTRRAAPARRPRSRPCGPGVRRPAHAERGGQAGPQVRLVHRRRRPGDGPRSPPVARAPAAVRAVDEVRHHDVAVQVRVAVAVDPVREQRRRPSRWSGSRTRSAPDRRTARDSRAAPGTPARRPPPRCAPRRRWRAASSPPRANTTLADLGALKVRSKRRHGGPGPIRGAARSGDAGPASRRRNARRRERAFEPEPGGRRRRPSGRARRRAAPGPRSDR